MKWQVSWISFFLGMITGASLMLATITVAHGRDVGQWKDSPTKDWYQKLMQPDNPMSSCCGEADAYWCDVPRVKQDKSFCVITDNRVVEGRPHVEMGTEIEIPTHKYKWDSGNPTGHAIVFLSRGGAVFCYVQNDGV